MSINDELIVFDGKSKTNLAKVEFKEREIKILKVVGVWVIVGFNDCLLIFDFESE